MAMAPISSPVRAFRSSNASSSSPLRRTRPPLPRATMLSAWAYFTSRFPNVCLAVFAFIEHLPERREELLGLRGRQLQAGLDGPALQPDRLQGDQVFQPVEPAGAEADLEAPHVLAVPPDRQVAVVTAGRLEDHLAGHWAAPALARALAAWRA